jgi:hypothetical protein
MPLTRFICPDGAEIDTTACLTSGGCRMAERCCTLPTLRLMATERPWTGRPSTTQLLKGTMEAFLRITHDYAVSPDDCAFRLAGTLSHGQMERFAVPNELAEESLGDDSMTGVADLLTESETVPNAYDLTDYKTKGAYAVKLMLGGVRTDPVLDEAGQPVLYQRGPNKGQPKVTEESVYDPAKSDTHDETLQLNRYRIWLEAAGFRIDRMQCEVRVRDGGLKTAAMYGIRRKIYMIPIPRLADADVLAYFERKTGLLLAALATRSCSVPCNDRECWAGRKCRTACPVAQWCERGQAVGSGEQEPEQ